MGRLKTLRHTTQKGEFFTFPPLGDTIVHLTLRESTNRISARWSSGKLHIIAPQGISRQSIADFMSANATALLSRRPGLRYSIGQELKFDGITFNISRQSLKPGKILMQGEYNSPRILVGAYIDLSTDEATAMISRLMCVAARTVAVDILIPFAAETSRRIGISPRQWTISRGHHTLGKCNSRGEIALSEILIFLPCELREYIICHELAHLSHFDHSPQFHATCDRYLGGREKLLIRQLKNYNWPILRK